MTDKEIVERAKEAEKRTGFGELVHSPISKGVNSAFGIGFIEGMVEYRTSMREEPVSEDLEQAAEECIEELIPESELNSTTPFALEYVVELLQKTFKAGARWQRQKDEHLIWQISTANYEKGIEEGKQQVIANAIEGTARPDDNEIWCNFASSNLKDGDKVKVIIIKKEEV